MILNSLFQIWFCIRIILNSLFQIWFCMRMILNSLFQSWFCIRMILNSLFQSWFCIRMILKSLFQIWFCIRMILKSLFQSWFCIRMILPPSVRLLPFWCRALGRFWRGDSWDLAKSSTFKHLIKNNKEIWHLWRRIIGLDKCSWRSCSKVIQGRENGQPAWEQDQI